MFKKKRVYYLLIYCCVLSSIGMDLNKKENYLRELKLHGLQLPDIQLDIAEKDSALFWKNVHNIYSQNFPSDQSLKQAILAVQKNNLEEKEEK